MLVRIVYKKRETKMKVLIIIAKQGFQDTEFSVPKKILEDNGFETVVASTEKGTCLGKFGLETEAEISFDDIDPDRFDAVFIVGGPGSPKLVGIEKLESILKKMDEDKKIISAICYAPVVLAKAGLLKNKKATVWNEDGSLQPLIEEDGASYVDKPVVVDDRFITGNGPDAAEEFGNTLLRILKSL